jgi:hypothetical protein
VLSNCCLVIAQSSDVKTDSTPTKAKSKKLVYIENYIANFPYKNSDIYEVIKQTNLWDTTGIIPVINANTISINRKPIIKTEEKAIVEIEQK